MLQRKIATERTSLACTSWYYVLGELGAVHYMFMRVTGHGEDKLYPLDVGVHSHTPLYTDQAPMHNCEILEGECYYSGSHRLATDLNSRFRVSQDPERLWRDLEQYYGQALML